MAKEQVSVPDSKRGALSGTPGNIALFVGCNIILIGAFVLAGIIFPSWLAPLIALFAILIIGSMAAECDHPSLHFLLFFTAIGVALAMGFLNFGIYSLAVPAVFFALTVFSQNLLMLHDESSDKKNAAVAYACENDDLKEVKRLVESGADVNAEKKIGLGGTPLTKAAARGDLAIVKCLVEHGADINKMLVYPGTALHAAAGAGRYEVAKYLIEKGADVSAKNEYYGRPMDSVDNAKVAELLIKSGANPVDGWFLAATNNQIDLLDVRIKHGVQVNTRDSNGKTALHYAAVGFGQGPEVGVKYLLQKGADPKVRDNSGKTAADCLKESGIPECRKILKLLETRTNRQNR